MDARQTTGTRERRPRLPSAAPQLVGDRIVRFLDPFADGGPARPSLCLVASFPDMGDGTTVTRLRPRWRARRVRSTPRRSFLLDLEPGTDLYGLGEAAGPLRRKGRRLSLWNLDHYAYDDKTPSLYQSHPWVLGVRKDGTAFGVLWDTPARCRVWAGERELLVRADDAGFPVYVIERDTPRDVLRALGDLTGRMDLPPLWALGYQQSRYSYYPEAEVRRIADELRLRRLPCDVIWFDIHYMDGNRSFTFDPVRFPDPASLIADLHGLGFRAVLMIDPGLKVDPAYHAYAQGHEQGAFVRTVTGDEYHGQVWPGACAFPDFLNRDVRAWWGELYRPLLDMDVDGFWNDMNEPAIFDGPGRTMPLDNIHAADAELGGPGTHARYHNVYGMMMVRGTREGIVRMRPETRPFVLTRSNFLGGQRYAATWTGDNSSTWSHLGWSITMALNLGLSGQPMSGPDIGGFEGNADGRLFARWMGIGAFMPFCRAHTDVWTREHEPWSWGPNVEATCRRALVRRYRLLPYWYTLFREASETGIPPVRPLFFADPRDARLRAVDDALLLGDDLMVRCRVTPDAPCAAPMPQGTWRRFELTEETDDELPEMWLRAGAMVPVGPALQHTAERPLDPLTLLIALDERGEASGLLYEDEGEGFGCLAGDYALTRYHARRINDRIEVTSERVGGMRHAAPRTLVVRLLTGKGEVLADGRDGEPIAIDLPSGV